MEDAIREYGADPDELDQTKSALFALRAEARKHGVTPDGLYLNFYEKTRKALDNLELGEAAFAHLEKEAAAAKARFEKGAKALSKRAKRGGEKT